jgi:hypothetical protein
MIITRSIQYFVYNDCFGVITAVQVIFFLFQVCPQVRRAAFQINQALQVSIELIAIVMYYIIYC